MKMRMSSRGAIIADSNFIIPKNYDLIEIFLQPLSNRKFKCMVCARHSHSDKSENKSAWTELFCTNASYSIRSTTLLARDGLASGSLQLTVLNW